MAKKSQKTMKFSFFLTEKNCISIPASPDETLEEAIRKVGTKLKGYCFKDHILFAQLNGPVGEAAILPGIVCSNLLPNGKIQSKSKKDATPDPTTVEHGSYEVDDSDGEEEANDAGAQMLFFVKSTNPGITKISHNSYDGKHLGVIFHDGQTIENALLNDGRFSDVQDLELRLDDDRKSSVGCNYLASNYRDSVFNAKRRPAKKRKRPSGESSTESVNSSEEVVYSRMPANLTQPSSQEFREGMIKDARRLALKMFAQAGDEEDTDKYILQATKKFGKSASSSIPARILERLGQAEKSVGYIECGDISGTCFLLDSKVIITCFHVINDIICAKSQHTDRESYNLISIHFNYNYPGRKGPPDAVVDEARLQYCIYSPQLDYVILPLKPAPETSALPRLTSLGPLVRSALPRSRLVILVGHPDNKHKLVEVCSIIPGYKWHATLCERAEDAGHYCEQNPEECHLNDPRQSCVHIYKGKYYDGKHSNQLEYDTSFFEGSSGSPVFNADGHIVAMHTQGYPFKRGSTKVSLMEFGVTFSAIFQDVKKRYNNQEERRLFPEIGM